MLHKTVKMAALAAAIAWSGAAYAQGVGEPGIGANGEGPNEANGPGLDGSNLGRDYGSPYWRRAGTPVFREGAQGYMEQRR